MSARSTPKNQTRSSTEISEEILRRIQSGRYLPGDSLSQYELASEFGTSRTPIREALRVLETKRAISLTESGRAMVAVPSVREIREVFEIRAELEGLAARLAVDWIDDKDLKQLGLHQKHYASTLRAQVRDEQGSQWRKHNFDFHDLIAQLSHNERLLDMVNELQGSTVWEALGFASRMPPRLMEENIQQHEAIIAALTRRDGAAARDAMSDHVLRTMRLVIDWMGSR